MFSAGKTTKGFITGIFLSISLPLLAVENATYDDFLNYYISQKPELKQDPKFAEAYAYYSNCKKMFGRESSEFSQRRAVNEAKKQLSAMGDAEKPTSILISERKKFGRYNFDTFAFPFSVFREGVVYTISNPEKGVCRTNYKHWPNEFVVKLTNPGVITEVPVEDEVLAEKVARVFITAVGPLSITSMDLDTLNRNGLPEPTADGVLTELEVFAGVGYGGRTKLPVKTFSVEELASLTKESAAILAAKPLMFNPKNVAKYQEALANGTADSLNPILITQAERLIVNYAGIDTPEKPEAIIKDGRENGKIYDKLSYRFGNQSFHFTIVNADDFSIELPMSEEIINAIKLGALGSKSVVDYYVRPIQVLDDKPNHLKVVLEKISFKYQNLAREEKLYTKDIIAKTN